MTKESAFDEAMEARKKAVPTSEWKAQECCGVRFMIGSPGTRELALVNAAQYAGKCQDTRRMCRMLIGWRTCARLGLLKPSFVPDQRKLDLRDLTWLRVRLVQDRTQLINRIRHPCSNREA